VYCDAQLARYGIEPQRPAIGPTSTVWDRATTGWVVGPDYGTLTQVLLPKLIDWPGIDVPPGSPHGPFIPRWEIEAWHHDEQWGKLKNGSIIRCKSNEQSQIRFAAAGVDWIHFDEEPAYRNYEEATLRVEAGRRLRIFGTCTLLPPEGQIGGVSWLYNTLIRPYLNGKRDIGLFGAAIWDNPYLLPEEIARLESRYPEGTPQYRIRLGGEWLPGIGGNQCYLKFRHELHVKPQGPPVWHVPLSWFIDFNVNPFCSGVGQYLNKRFHVYKIFELEDGNVDGMVEAFRQAYPTHGADIWMYGDATGEGRSVQTAQSNYTLIRRGMQNYPTALKMNIPLANPHRKDRVNAVNRALQDTYGTVSVEIDPSCEPLILDLEQVLADAEGGPKKTTNSRDPYFFRTHSSDGLGYWICKVAPVVGLGEREERQQQYAVAPTSPFQRPGHAPVYARGGR
jgi:phage terminase large subunit-like protein